MCLNHIQKYICTHTHLPLIHTHTLFCVWFTQTHIPYYCVGFIHTHTHIYTALLSDTHTYIHVYFIILCLIQMHTCTHKHMYTMLFDSYTQITHICIILFCIICVYIHTHTLYTTVYLIYMHILTYWYNTYTLKCIIANHIHTQSIFFKAKNSNVKDTHDYFNVIIIYII